MGNLIACSGGNFKRVLVESRTIALVQTNSQDSLISTYTFNASGISGFGSLTADNFIVLCSAANVNTPAFSTIIRIALNAPTYNPATGIVTLTGKTNITPGATMNIVVQCICVYNG